MKEKKKNIILNYSSDNKNTGKSEVQIALLTHQINYLKEHFLIHKNDFSGKRGLLKMVSKRRKLLNYLKKNNISQYNDIIKSLNLRH